MKNPIRPIVPALLIAFSAMGARAYPQAAAATQPVPPATTQPSNPIDLTLHPAPAAQSAPTDPALQSTAAPQSAPLNLALPATAASPSAPINLALPSTATPQSASINLALPSTAAPQPTPINPALPSTTAPQPAPNDLVLHAASSEMQRVARWVIDSGDNAGLPYLVIDKVNAQVFAFNRTGQLQGTAAVLLGKGKGDRLIAANNTSMGAIPPQDRITPAGRFVSRLAIDSHGKELLVLDYDAAISLHAVVKGTPVERRAERLKSPTAEDNRVSYGCINVPAPFYSTIVSPTFTGTKGIVYVLPETSTASELFGILPVGAAASGVPGAAQQSSAGLNPRAPQTIQAPNSK